MARLFVAVPLAGDVLDAIAMLPRGAPEGVRWTRREQWHVTVRFLGECPLGEALEALGALDASAARVTLGPVVSRLGRNVVCVPVEGLGELRAAVSDVTAGLGEPVDPRPFRGHVTLARLKHQARCPMVGEELSASFVADRVELVESTLLPAGPVYETRLAVPLCAAAP